MFRLWRGLWYFYLRVKAFITTATMNPCSGYITPKAEYNIMFLLSPFVAKVYHTPKVRARRHPSIPQLQTSCADSQWHQLNIQWGHLWRWRTQPHPRIQALIRAPGSFPRHHHRLATTYKLGYFNLLSLLRNVLCLAFLSSLHRSCFLRTWSSLICHMPPPYWSKKLIQVEFATLALHVLNKIDKGTERYNISIKR